MYSIEAESQKLQQLPAPGQEPQSLTDCFDLVFKHEVDNTTAIYNLVNIAFEEKDWASWNFLQWFVKEQMKKKLLQ